MLVTLNASDLAEKGGLFVSTLAQSGKEALRVQAGEAYGRIVSGKYWANRTGRTRSTFAIRQTGSMSVSVESRDKVARFLDTGTRAHPIVARRAPQLVFYWARMGRMFYGKRVNHPGTKATAFIEKERWRGMSDLAKKVDYATSAAVLRTGIG